MKPFRHIIMHSLLILPLQNAWSMAGMAPCEMAMPSDSGVTKQVMDTQDCAHHADMAMNVDDHIDQDCGDNHCTNCSHVTFLLPLDFTNGQLQAALSNMEFSNNLLSILPYPDSPPPIIS